MLDATEKAYFESLVWEKINPIRERHFAELENINPLNNPGNSPAAYTHKIRQFKKDLAEARIQAYIETYKRIGRYPGEGEFDGFAEELFKIVDNKGSNLPRHFRGGLSPLPPEAVERIEEQLSAQIRQDAGVALSSLHHFINEGKLEALQKERNNQQPGTVESAVNEEGKQESLEIAAAHPSESNQTSNSPKRDKVFFSYSRKDKKWLELFQTSLKPLIRDNLFSVWDDTKIEAGEVWRDELKRALASAKVAVLLVSRNFLASDFIAENELPPLLEAAQTEGLKIILVIVGHSLFEETKLGSYQAVNDPARPLAGISAANREKEVVRICKVIRDAASEGSSKIVSHSGNSSEIVNHVEEAHHVIKSGQPPIIHKLRFVLLQDKQVRSLPDGNAFEMEFRLLNSSSPPSELNNVFGHYWVMGARIIGATIPPARGEAEGGRVEWDIQIPVFPKGGVFLPAKIAARMPEPGSEVLVGAQVVSRETSLSEYLWSIVNDNGVPKIIFKKSPPE